MPWKSPSGSYGAPEDPKREVTDRRFGRLLELAHTVAPPSWEAVLPRVLERLAFGREGRGGSRGGLVVPIHDDR